MKIVLITIIVLILGAMFIANILQTDFKSSNSNVVFAKIYFRWILQVGRNVRDLSVTAYNMNWLPVVEQSE